MSRENRPVVLIVGGVAVLAAALLLFLVLRSGDDATDAPTQPAAGGSTVAAAPTPPPRADSSRPGQPQVSASVRDGSADAGGYTETIVNGMRVRDHRKNRSTPVERLIPDRAPGSRTIDPKITASINDQLLPRVRECAAGVPPEARGPKPRIEGKVILAIKDGQAQITQANVDLTDVVGASIEPTKQCLEQKAREIKVPADNEPDLESYAITIRYAVP
jgi:hypothetical protein